MPFDIESIERATLDAVAPTQIDTLPGWLLPFDRSGIARANSAVPLRHANLDPHSLPLIEARYASQRSACQFRLADVPGLAPLQQALEHRAYSAHRPVLTQTTGQLNWRPGGSATPIQLSPVPTAHWRSVYFAEEFDASDSAARVAALARGRHAIYGWTEDDSGPLAAGTAVLSQGWLSIHGMRTRERARGRGLAKQLIAAFFAAGRARGLDRAFLQVEEDNLIARQAYQSCGFNTAWRYHYWHKP